MKQSVSNDIGCFHVFQMFSRDPGRSFQAHKPSIRGKRKRLKPAFYDSIFRFGFVIRTTWTPIS